jgi:hypothetical protein
MRTYDGKVLSVAPDAIRVEAGGRILNVRRDDFMRWTRKRCVGPCDSILISGFDMVDHTPEGDWFLRTTRDIVGLQVEVSFDSSGVRVAEKPTSQRATGICAPNQNPLGTS